MAKKVTRNTHTNKVWMVTYRYGGARYFKSEQAFLENVRAKRDGKVSVFERIEFHESVDDYKDSVIRQRERDEQLTMVLGNDEVLQNLSILKNILVGKSTKENYTNRNILNKFKTGGLKKENFDGIISKPQYKKYLLYYVSKEQSYYELLLRIHNFMKLDENISKEACDNFKKAKEVIKKEKEDKKKALKKAKKLEDSTL